MANKEDYARLMAAGGTGANHKPDNLRAPNGGAVFGKGGQSMKPMDAVAMQRAVEHTNQGGTDAPSSDIGVQRIVQSSNKGGTVAAGSSTGGRMGLSSSGATGYGGGQPDMGEENSAGIPAIKVGDNVW